jgi:hypothetical protein
MRRAVREFGHVAVDVVQGWLASFAVECALALVGLKETLAWMERHGRGVRTPVANDEFLRRARAVRWAYRVSPFRGTCLRRSLVHYWLDRSQGHATRFFVGVRRNGDIEAHAWLQNDDVTSDGTGETFSVLLRSPEDDVEHEGTSTTAHR